LFNKTVKENAKICAEYISGPCGWGSDGDVYLDTQESEPNLSFQSSGIGFTEIKPNLVQVKLNVYPSVKDATGYYEKTITFKMIKENGRWVVADVMYADGASSLQNMADENAVAMANPDPDSPAAIKKTKNRR
jgi:hypothetical protein